MSSTIAGIALPAAWAALVVSAAWATRPVGGRLSVLVAAAPPATSSARGASRRRAAARRAERHRRRAIAAAVPEAADLFRVAVGAGLTVRLAVAAVAEVLPGPLGDELRTVDRSTAVGARLADALDGLAAGGGDDVRPLAATLASSDRYGLPCGPQLERLADEVRASARRRAEEVARKVPVKLLFPLVTCILPAFALLTVAPLLASALRALRL